MFITIHDCELYTHSRGPKNFNWNISLCLRYNVYSLMESYVIVHGLLNIRSPCIVQLSYFLRSEGSARGYKSYIRNQ